MVRANCFEVRLVGCAADPVACRPREAYAKANNVYKEPIVVRKHIAFALIVGLFVSLSGTAHAYQVSSDNQSTLGADKTVNGTYYAAGSKVTVRGTITGDVICAGQDVEIDANVGGDVLCAAQTITIKGTVAGNVRLLAQTATLSGTVGKNVSILGSELTTTKESSVGGDVMAQVAKTILGGSIGGETYGSGQSLELNGPVKGGVHYVSDEVNVGSGAVLGSGLAYTSARDAVIDPSARISGKTTRTAPPEPQPKQSNVSIILSSALIEVLSALALASLLVWLLPRLSARSTSLLRRPGGTMLLGLAAIFLVPIAAILVMVTVIGLPIGLISFVLWGIALYVSRIVTALAVGKVLLGRFGRATDARPRPYLEALIGVVVTTIAFLIPVVGGFALFLAVLFGMGVLVQVVRDHIDREDSIPVA